VKKSLQLQIDGASWTAVPPPYRKSCPFLVTQNEATVDFLGALLWVGITSVSIRLPSWWLASQWALVRYVAAADHRTRRLRLPEAADDLDTHHKKVLSDDWGGPSTSVARDSVAIQVRRPRGIRDAGSSG